MLGIKLYNMQEASKILGVSERTLFTYIKSERLKANKIRGKWMITEDNLKKFIQGEK